MPEEVKKLVTHDGSFHTDDVFACATLMMMLEAKGEKYEISRTRDFEKISNGDYVFDVGEIYNKDENRFDHHQTGGAGKRANSIEYASFGLVWEKFGKEVCGDQRVADFLDKKLVAPIDAWDNGFDLVENKYEVTPYYLQHIFASMRPTWKEDSSLNDEMFLKAVVIAKEILSREIIQAKDALSAEDSVIEIYKNSEDKRIIVLDKNYPADYTLNGFPEPLFIVYPRSMNNLWSAKAVRKDPKTFVNRKDFPQSWGGKRDEELQKLSGVEDAVFCHKALYMVVAKSRKGAVKLAQIAIES